MNTPLILGCVAALALIPIAYANDFDARDFMRYVIGLEEKVDKLEAENRELKRLVRDLGNVPPSGEIGRDVANKEWGYYRSWMNACNPLTLGGNEAITAFFKHGSGDIRTEGEAKAQPPWMPARGEHRYVCTFTYFDDTDLRWLKVQPDRNGGFYSQSYHNDASDCNDRYGRYSADYSLVRFIEANICGSWPTRGR